MKKYILAILPCVAYMVGCSSVPPINYTVKPLTPNYVALIKQSAKEGEFKDPNSLQFKIGKPKIGKCDGHTMYEIPVEVNAKNSFGAYTGFKESEAYMSNSKVMGFGSCRGQTLAGNIQSREAMSNALRRALSR